MASLIKDFMRKILTILVLSSVFISFDNGIYARVDDARLKKMYGKTYGSIAVVLRRDFYAGVNEWNKRYGGRRENYGMLRLCYPEIENRNYDGIKIICFNLDNANFKNIKMRKSIFKFMFFEGSFVNTDFSQSVFRRVYLGAKYIKCIFDNSRFERATFSSIYLFSRKMVYCSFKWVSMQHPKFEEARLINCDFSHAVFKKAEISCGNKFSGCNFKGVDLRGTKFIYTLMERRKKYKKTVFINCNFTNADLRNIFTLNNVVFKNCDFKGVKVHRIWYGFLKSQRVRNFDKIVWSAHGR